MSATTAARDLIDLYNSISIVLPATVSQIVALTGETELAIEMALLNMEDEGLACRLDAEGTRWSYEDMHGNKVLGTFADLVAVVEGGGLGGFNAAF